MLNVEPNAIISFISEADPMMDDQLLLNDQVEIRMKGVMIEG